MTEPPRCLRKTSFYGVQACPRLGRFIKLHWSTTIPSVQSITSSYSIEVQSFVLLFQWPLGYCHFSVKTNFWKPESLWKKLLGAGSWTTRFQALLNLGTDGSRQRDFWPDGDTIDLSSGESNLYITDFSLLWLLLHAIQDTDGQKASKEVKPPMGHSNRVRGKWPWE